MTAHTSLSQRLLAMARRPLMICVLLCGVLALIIEFASVGNSRTLAPLPRWTGYFLVVALVAMGSSARKVARLWRISLHARQDQEDSLKDAGNAQRETRELDVDEDAQVTVKGRLLREDSSEHASLQLALRGSQATSWSTHLPPQLCLRLEDGVLALRGVATIEAGSHERWLEYQPEVRPPAATPPPTLVVVERSLHTGDAVVVRGRLAKRQGGPRSGTLLGDHRQPMQLVSVRAPIVSLPAHADVQRSTISKRWALALAPLVYLAAQYHWTAAECSMLRCQSSGNCHVTARLAAVPFRCAAGLPTRP